MAEDQAADGTESSEEDWHDTCSSLLHLILPACWMRCLTIGALSIASRRPRACSHNRARRINQLPASAVFELPGGHGVEVVPTFKYVGSIVQRGRSQRRAIAGSPPIRTAEPLRKPRPSSTTKTLLDLFGTEDVGDGARRLVNFLHRQNTSLRRMIGACLGPDYTTSFMTGLPRGSSASMQTGPGSGGWAPQPYAGRWFGQADALCDAAA
eukprot:358996-Chlamydomonas_euryale.AAC.11